MMKLAASLVLCSTPVFLHGAATITIVNADPAGVGFNDPTPAAPVGGNPGTTVGAQRLNAFQRAAEIWGATLTSTVPILVRASWPALSCDATSAVLGSAGPRSVHANFSGAPQTGAWYHQALANKLNGTDLGTLEDINAQFNGNLGQPGCLTGRFFYLGLDGNAPANTINFLTVLLHELGHGLGFSTTTNGSTGAFLSGLPSIYDFFLLDKATNAKWASTSAFVRSQSAVNGQGNLVWDGAIVKAAVPGVLTPAAQLSVTAPATAAATYIGAPSNLGPSLATPVSGELMPVVSTDGGGNGCAPLAGFDALAVSGKVALIDRGGCAYVTKIQNAQNAGATAVVFVNNVMDTPPVNIWDPTPGIVIQNAMISMQDGTVLKNLLRFRSRTSSGVFVTLGQSPTVRAGADAANRVIMYAPSLFSGGSSISHWDISAARNLLMEPFTNPDLSLSVQPPQDLTFTMLQDIGW